MKKIIVEYLVVAALFSTPNVFGTIVFSDNFNVYNNGSLAGVTQDALGQGTWRQSGSSAATPIQVVNGAIALGPSGQDVYSPLTTPTLLADGQSIYFSLDINVTAAQSAGDYFLHFTPNAGNTSLFL